MKSMRRISSYLLCAAILSTQLFAEQHVVSPSEMRRSLGTAAKNREQKLAQFDRLLSHDGVQNALQSAKMDPVQVREAAALLSDEELGRLSVQAGKLERDIAAGALNNQELTYIVIALATAVIVIVILKA